MSTIICDVCDTLITITHGVFISDGEYLKLLCPQCGFDNSYQTNEGNSEYISDSLFSDSELDYEELIHLIIERYGVTIERATRILNEHEIFDNGFSIQRNFLDEL